MNAPTPNSDVIARAETTVASSASFLERLAERIGGQATVKAVFGEPIICGDMTIIPVARAGFGFGGGAGGGGEAGEAGQDKSGGGGAGGGGGAETRPLGYIAVHNGVATYNPIRNATFDNAVTLVSVIAAIIAPKIAKTIAARLRK